MPFIEFYDTEDNMAVDNLNAFEKDNFLLKIHYALTSIEGTMRSSILVQYKPKKPNDTTSKESGNQ